ncbi:MAG: epoxide hydrolase N-terminal domain-containing protein, partial [Nitrososphaeraceae archaeon]
MSNNQDNLKDGQISRAKFLKLVGAGSMFLGLGAFGISNILNNIREASAQGANATNATEASAAPPGNNLGIRSFRVNVPEAELTELRRRVSATRWPERETVTDVSQGVQLATMQKLARYWATDYDWRKVEARLNALPQFITKIDGLDIHFIHV